MPPRQGTSRSPDEIRLATPIEQLPGITEAQARGLHELGLASLGKLVGHLPMRHERLEAESEISELAAGGIVSARGEVTATRVAGRGRAAYGKGARFEAVLHDGSSRLDLVWFNGGYLKDKILPGMRLRVQGKAKRFGFGIQLANPTWEIIDPAKDEPAQHESRLRPVYPAMERLASKVIEKIIARVWPIAEPLILDHFDDAYRAARGLPSLAEAYRMQHAPRTMDEVAASRRRLAYDELLLLQLGVELKRQQTRGQSQAAALPWSAEIDRRVRGRMPFTLTESQDGVLKEIIADLGRESPANRLIQGDVGSGKTAVAVYAMLLTVAAKQQAAMLAPTNILAEQHYATVTRMLAGSDVRVELLTGSTETSVRDRIHADLASGAIDILIGTHALLTEAVRFHSLALAVVDEQHRFGVHQRAALREKASNGGAEGLNAKPRSPHMLVMTATPIPRSLAMTLFGDLDISTIRGLPPGRSVTRTRVVPAERRAEVYAFVRERLERGEQAFIVAPTIDGGVEREESFVEFVAEPLARRSGNDAKGVASAASGSAKPAPNSSMHVVPTVEGLMERLDGHELKGLRLGVVHGRLARETREAVMERFRLGKVDALIATTVIEVGVDIPNATIVVVEQADRFGLSQLHQLRGRVGRGEKPGVCILIADDPSQEGVQRLEALATTNDGFVIADRDLELRGMGELFGVKQSGMPGFRAVDLSKDVPLLMLARKDAKLVVEGASGLPTPATTLLRQRLMRTHGPWLGLGDVG